jgi:MFS family permease
MVDTAVPAPPQRFYGWTIVAVSFVQLTFSAGLGFYGLALYLKTLTEQRGFKVSEVSLATSLFWVSVAISGVFIARLIARFDPRWVIGVGGAAGGLAIALIGRATTLWQLFPLYVLFGAGFTGTAVLVANTVLTRWFHQKRSSALSIATTGLSVGGIVLTPIAARLIDDRSLVSAMTIIGVMFFIGSTIPAAIFLRPTPASMGQFPDGITPKDQGAAAGPPPGVQFLAAVNSTAFKAITATFTLGLLGQVGAISQVVKLAKERAGAPTNQQIISVLAACSVVGRLSGGVIVTKLTTRKFAYVALALQIAGMTILAFAQTQPTLLVGAGVFGLGVGNVLLLHPLLLAEVFGVRDYGRILGRSSIFVSVGNAVGPFMMGYARDHLGGYTTSYLLAVGLSILGLLVYHLWGGHPAPAH